MCYVKPFFGPFKWELPACDIEYPSGPEKYRYLAKFILDGTLFPELKTFQSYLISSPSVITNTITNNSMTTFLLSLLNEKKIDNKQKKNIG